MTMTHHSVILTVMIIGSPVNDDAAAAPTRDAESSWPSGHSTNGGRLLVLVLCTTRANFALLVKATRLWVENLEVKVSGLGFRVES